jgi:hypothetical protein
MVLLTPSRAHALGFTAESAIVVLRAGDPLTTGQRDALADVSSLAEDEQLDNPGAPRSTVQWSVPESGLDPLAVQALLAGLALLFTLFVVAASLALAAAETRDERDVLSVVGAAPKTMRRASGQKAVLLTVLGAVLAIPVGFLPVSVFVAASDKGEPLVFPWPTAGLLLFVVPIASGLFAWAGSAIGTRVRPVAVSTMTFE